MTKQSILGKIIFISIFNLSLFANISATVDKPTFFQGDEVTIEIKAEGEKVEFADLKTIGGFKINNSSKSEQILIVNGKPTKSKSASYTFTPNKSMTIPPILVKINGKNYNTTQLKITKIQPETTGHNDDFQLILTTSKNKVYTGEPIVAAIIFKHKSNLDVLDAKLDPFLSEGFLVKELPNSQQKDLNGYTIYQNNYILFPQKSGIFTIQNQLINIATREPKTNFMKWKRVFSKEQSIQVLPLPNKISIQGAFKIEASVDKKETKQNTPVNLTIKIEGLGNINDIPEFPLVLKNEIAYSTKPQIKTVLQNGRFGGVFVQKVSIISENDFTIPPFSLQYFNPITKQIQKITTEPINIKVTGMAKDTPQIEKADKNGNVPKNSLQDNDAFIRYSYGLIGFLIGLIIAYVFTKQSKWKKADTPFVKQIKTSKNDKELYYLLLPHSQNPKLKVFIRLLEENIYKGKKEKIDKQSLIDILDEEI